jgi:hypothetical protein
MTAGRFTGPAEKSDIACPECQHEDVIVRLWESDDGAHEDYWHHCNHCGHNWWVEGADA